MPAYALDARADLVGPTVDANAEQDVPLFRQETHQLQAAKAPPIRVKGKPRPLNTGRVDHQLKAAKAVVLSRQSNQNPANGGGDDVTGIWGVSDPWGHAPFLGNAGGARGAGLVLAAI